MAAKSRPPCEVIAPTTFSLIRSGDTISGSLALSLLASLLDVLHRDEPRVFCQLRCVPAQGLNLLQVAAFVVKVGFRVGQIRLRLSYRRGGILSGADRLGDLLEPWKIEGA